MKFSIMFFFIPFSVRITLKLHVHGVCQNLYVTKWLRCYQASFSSLGGYTSYNWQITATKLSPKMVHVLGHSWLQSLTRDRLNIVLTLFIGQGLGFDLQEITLGLQKWVSVCLKSPKPSLGKVHVVIKNANEVWYRTSI